MKIKYVSSVAILAISSTMASAQYGAGGGMGGKGTRATPSSTYSYGSKTAAVAGAAAAAAVLAGVLYRRHHKHATVVGCVGEDGKSLFSDTKNRTYKLETHGVELEPRERVELAGTLNGTKTDLLLDVQKLRKDFGSCRAELSQAR
jgi:hypothetical protein